MFSRDCHRSLLKHQSWFPHQLEEVLLIYYHSDRLLFSVMLLQSQLPHEGLVVDLLLGADCSPELHCHHNSHGCIVLSNSLSFCWESLVFRSDIFQICPGESRTYSVSLWLDPSPAGMFSCCCYCSGKFQFPH